MAKAATATKAEVTSPPKPPAIKMTSPKIDAGSIKAALAAAGATKTSALVMVPVDQIHVIPGFNVRATERKEYTDDMADLTSSITKGGFDPSHPLSGFVGKDGDADVIYLIDGHRRYAATLAAIEGGAEVTSVPVVLKPNGFTMRDANIALHRENIHTKLTMAEKSIIVARLLKMDMSEEDIASELGITVRAVQDFLLLVNASKTIRSFVRSGKIAGTLAVELLRKHSKAPEKAEQIMVDAVAKAESRGDQKATKKHTSEGTKGGKVAADGDEKTASGQRPAKLVQRMEEVTIKWSISKDQEFPLADIKRFKMLFADTDWYSLISDKSGYAMATEDVTFKASIVRPKKEAQKSDEPAAESEEDPAEDAETDEAEGEDATDL